jgi:zinc protease
MTAPSFDLPRAANIYQQALPNGLQILVYENPSTESVVVYGSLRAGSVYEDSRLAGLASMTAASLLRGTKSRDFDAIHSALEDIGAEFEYSASKFRVNYSGRALAEDLPTLINILADTLQNPIFPEAEIAEERQKRLTELNYASQNPQYVAGRNFREALYPTEHPFHYSSYGSPQSLVRIQTEDLRRFHQAQYGTQGMYLIIVGAVQAEKAAALAAEAFGNWQNPRQAATPALAVLNPPQKIIRVDASIVGKTQSDILLGTLGPSRYAEDYLAAQVANSILGEFGMMGWLGNVIREELGLAYYAYSRLDGGEGQGAWAISAGVAPENVEVTIEKSREEIAQLITEGVSEEDLEDNQSYFTGRLPLRLESNYGLASIIHSMLEFNLGLDYLMGYSDRIMSLTQDDILKASQHYLHPDKLVISVAG